MPHKRFNLKIKHRKWEQALAESHALLVTASPGEVVCIVGPSRVGKSRLIQELSSLLSGKEIFLKTDLMPVVSVEAVNTGPNGSFSTKAFTMRMLEAVKHPILSIKGSEFGNQHAYQKIDRSTEATLRHALERAFRARKTKYLIIDEAQHAKYASKSTQGAYAVLDSWKCLAQTNNLILVLVGAYPILPIIENSPHLLGRKHQVHFSRYLETQEDIKDFAKIVSSYEQEMDGNVDGSLVKNIELLYQGTYGCIGLLRAWLSRAYAISVARQEILGTDILREFMPSDSDRLAIKSEIDMGESFLRVSLPDKRDRIQDKNRSSNTSVKKKNKPFQRNPKRYKQGGRS